MSVEGMELKLVPPELMEQGWRFFMRDSAAPFIGENEKLALSTGGYPTKDEVIQAARDMAVEEEERAAIETDGGPKEPVIEIEPGRRTLPVNSIRTDGGTQPRSALDMLVVAEYKDAMLNGDEFPPVDVYFDGKDLWLADGFHRLQARKEADVERDILVSTIVVDVKLGSKREALLYALGANATHGLPRSREDKRRAVTMMLEDDEWTTFSDSVIAQRCNVSQPFVGKVRRELVSQNVLSEQPTRTGADGVVRDTSNIGKPTEEDERQSSLLADSAEPIATATSEQAEADRVVAAEPQLSDDEDQGRAHDDEARNTAWTSEGIVELLKRHGGVLMRMQLEEMGVSYAAIHQALADEAIIQPETGKFTLPDHKPQPSSSGQATTATHAEPQLPKTSIDDLLKGRKLAVSFAWIPGLKGKVNVTVNAGDKPETATRQLMDSDRVRGFHADVQKMIVDQLNGVKSASSSTAARVVKRTSKSPAKRASKTTKKAPAKKKAAAKKKAVKGRRR